MNGLKGKAALVTGATGLIGTAIATRLAAEGATSVIASRSLSKATAWVEQHKGSGSYVPVRIDLSDAASIREGVQALPEVVRHPSVIVANASLREGLATEFGQLTPESFSGLFKVDLAGHFLLLRELIERLPAGQPASIVLMSSIYGQVGVDHAIYPEGMMHTPVTYAAVKGAALSMTRWLAGLWGERGVRVNAVVAGGVRSGARQPEEFVRNYSRKTMLGRMATPEEIANAVVFLASEEASYVTGQCLSVDGGFTAW